MKLFIQLLIPIFVIGLFNNTTQAQDYNAQVDAIKNSFETKSIEPIRPYVSSELSFRAYPAAVTPQILAQVFTNLPKLSSIEIKNSQEGEAEIKYEFLGLGVRESKLFFDKEGKITKIELIDNLLREQEEAQAAAANMVQAPSPGQLGEKYQPQKVQFPSKDGLMITGNLYEVDSSKPVILLAHSGGGNKFEYADIAPKLNDKGFNALAIDQRSGGTFVGQENETFTLAKSKGLDTEFPDAEQDIEAAIAYLANKYDKKITLWGSSYSAALSLFIVQKGTEHLNGMILFSPGDYLAPVKGSLEGRLTKIEIPFLITSTQQEAKIIGEVLLKGADLSDSQVQHIPSFAGFHGSVALWEGQEGAEEYWEQVWNMLEIIYPQ